MAALRDRSGNPDQGRVPGYKVATVEIPTIYFDQNRRSHFDPLWDSMRVVAVLSRYALSSLAVTAVDFSAFVLLLPHVSGNVVAATSSRGSSPSSRTSCLAASTSSGPGVSSKHRKLSAMARSSSPISSSRRRKQLWIYQQPPGGLEHGCARRRGIGWQCRAPDNESPRAEVAARHVV
jgi:hypothetical protein